VKSVQVTRKRRKKSHFSASPARLQVKSTPQPGQSSTSTPRWPSPSHSRLPGPGPARAAVRDRDSLGDDWRAAGPRPTQSESSDHRDNITCSHGHCHCHPVTVRRSESGPATPGVALSRPGSTNRRLDPGSRAQEQTETLVRRGVRGLRTALGAGVRRRSREALEKNFK